MSHFKSVVSVAVACVALGAAVASAADMPVKARPPAAPVATWTGCYGGLNAGLGWSHIDQLQIGTTAGVVASNDFGRAQGVDINAGAQVGCDYQYGSSWVFGVRGQFDVGKIRSHHVIPTFPAFESVDRVKDTWKATARAGYLFAPSWLAYVQGGGAWAKTDSDHYGFGPPSFVSQNADDVSRSGWTVGAGVEYMMSPNWTAFAEFNYLDFGTKNITYVAAPGTVGAPSIVATKLQVEQVLVGANYRFNWGAPFLR